VDVVNSVQFSNHTGYPQGWEGDVINGDKLKNLIEGLKRNNLLENIGHLLTGYIGSESFLRGIVDIIQTLRKNKEYVRYVCDPVLGDRGELYVPKELVTIYRDQVIPLADVILPNQFEAEQLTGITIKSMNDVKQVCKALHELGPEIVVITSALIDEGKTNTVNSKHIFIIASCKKDDDSNLSNIWCIKSPIIEGNYTGAGDLFSALLLGWTAIEPRNLPLVIEKIASTMYSIIKATAEHSSSSVASKELRLIQSKLYIEAPPNLFKAIKLS